MTTAAPAAPELHAGPPNGEVLPLEDPDLAQDILSMKNLAENWDSFTVDGLVEVEPNPQKRLFAKRMVAPVLEALDSRGKLIAEPDEHTPDDVAARIQTSKETADLKIQETIADCLDPEKLNEYGLTPGQARSRLLGILHMGEEEDRRVMSLTVDDKAAKTIAHRHRSAITRTEAALHPYAKWDDDLQAAHPTRLGRAFARVGRGLRTPHGEQLPYTTATQRIGTQRTRQTRPFDNRERFRSLLHPLEKRGPRQTIEDHWQTIEGLMGRTLSPEERSQVAVVGDAGPETKQDREASAGSIGPNGRGLAGLSAAVERLGGPIVRLRHQQVSERSTARREAMRFIDPEAEGRLERIGQLRTVKNLILQGWERGQPAPGESRENLKQALDQWQEEVFDLGFAPREVVEELNKGFYQLDERDILAGGATTATATTDEKWFVDDPEYGDRGIAFKDEDGNIEVTFADGTDRVPDTSLPDDPNNPLKLGPRLRGDNYELERPDLPPVLGKPDRRLTTTQAEELYSIYDHERTQRTAEVAYKACISQAERLEARARRLNNRLNPSLNAATRAATETRLNETIRVSRQWRLRQAELQGAMQGFRELQEPPSPQTKAGRSIVARLTGRSRTGVQRPQPVQSHTSTDRDGNITWFGGETLASSTARSLEEVSGDITFNPNGDIIRYRRRPAA